MHQIKISDGMEFELTDEQAKFAFCWVSPKGNLIQDPNSMSPALRDIVENGGDCSGLHHDD
jgi:hypothetical protein